MNALFITNVLDITIATVAVILVDEMLHLYKESFNDTYITIASIPFVCVFWIELSLVMNVIFIFSM